MVSGGIRNGSMYLLRSAVESRSVVPLYDSGISGLLPDLCGDAGPGRLLAIATGDYLVEIELVSESGSDHTLALMVLFTIQFLVRGDLEGLIMLEAQVRDLQVGGLQSLDSFNLLKIS